MHPDKLANDRVHTLVIRWRFEIGCDEGEAIKKKKTTTLNDDDESPYTFALKELTTRTSHQDG